MHCDHRFYPACVYLSTSKIAVAVMGNMGFACALLIQKAVISIFLGQLRDLEVEMVRCPRGGRCEARMDTHSGSVMPIIQIREKISSTVMESLLALTIFRWEHGHASLPFPKTSLSFNDRC